jgi:hypothetical protein
MTMNIGRGAMGVIELKSRDSGHKLTTIVREGSNNAMTDYQMETFIKLVIQVVKANKDNADETIRILNGMLKTSMPEEKETE